MHGSTCHSPDLLSAQTGSLDPRRLVIYILLNEYIAETPGGPGGDGLGDAELVHVEGVDAVRARAVVQQAPALVAAGWGGEGFVDGEERGEIGTEGTIGEGGVVTGGRLAPSGKHGRQPDSQGLGGCDRIARWPVWCRRRQPPLFGRAHGIPPSPSALDAGGSSGSLALKVKMKRAKKFEGEVHLDFRTERSSPRNKPKRSLKKTTANSCAKGGHLHGLTSAPSHSHTSARERRFIHPGV